MGRYTALISAEDLRDNFTRGDWAIVDCRFSLADPPAGRQAYVEAHVPGAVYAHLDEDLSGPVIKGKTGRHPLPDPAILAERLGKWGINNRFQVIAYDASGAAMAGRLWWLLRWLGHEAVAVLDGGWPAWVAGGYPVKRGVETREPRSFTPRLRGELALDSAEVNRIRSDPGWRVLDARAADRYRGENETIDPVAGHIPGAISAPYAANLAPDGRFKAPAELRESYSRLLGPVPPDRVVCYCGSGVTAVHDLIAMEHAGLGGGRLYPGSWSEWITDPKRPTTPLAKT